MIDGGVDASLHTSSEISERRELPRQLGQVGGGVGRAPRGRVPGSGIERFRDRGFRSGCRERQVARPLLRVDDQLRETCMDPAPSPCGRRSVDGRPQERVGEVDPFAVDPDDVRLLRFRDPGERVVGIVRRAHDQIHRGPGRRRGGDERFDGARRERAETRSQQLL